MELRIILDETEVPVPLCNGVNTSERAAVPEAALVRAVVEDIRRARMEDQVILNSGSPSILKQALAHAPEIKRALSLNVLQLLTPEQVEEQTGLPVVEIPKNGLKWYNVGPIAPPRLLGTQRSRALQAMRYHAPDSQPIGEAQRKIATGGLAV